MKRNLNILFLILLLTGLGLNGYAQNLPYTCAGSIEGYGVYGDNGNSTFDWVVTGGKILRNYNDSIIVQWDSIPGAHFLTVTETDIWGCTGEPYQDTVILNIPFVDIGMDQDVCKGDSYTFIASADDVSSYLWQDGSSGETFIANEQGDYWVKVTDQYGCTNSDTASLIVHELPAVDLGSDTTFCGDGELTFDVSDYGSRYEWWTPGVDMPVTTPTFSVMAQTQDQIIWVNVADDYGCMASDTIVVRFCGDLEIPNAFTPNGDTHNDEWKIEQLINFKDVTVDIYNRWGERVFHSTGYSAGQYWKGVDEKGNKLPMDAYYYIIDLHNGEEPIVGTVTIIR